MAKIIHPAPLLFLLLSICPQIAQAATVEATSHITEATVYADRALVTRSAKVHLTAGSHVVSLTGLPLGLNEATLRVQGKATAAVKIGAVDLKHIYSVDAANAAERDKTGQIEAKMDEKAYLQGEIEALKAKRAFITHVVEAGASKQDPSSGAKLDFTPEKWQQAWGLVHSGMAETEKDLASKMIVMRKLEAELAKLQLELEQVRSQRSTERLEAHVNVEAAAETDMDVSLTYQTNGAAWQPVYDARLDTNSGQLDLEQYGSVSQTTGEDWSDVALTLSTAQPASGADMQMPSEWWINLLQPMNKMDASARVAKALSSGGSALPAPVGAPGGEASLYMRKMEDSAPAPQAAEQIAAAATTTEYSAEFKVQGHVDVKSTRDASKLHIGDVKMKAELAAQTMPRLGAQAYLFAKTTNHESYPLIPGLVAKYRDGAFIGNSSLPLVRPDEDAKFAFGVDDRIKVEYRRIKDVASNPSLVIMGDMSVERQDQIKVQNLHKEPVSITVFDQYPVSNDADVKVALVDEETTPGYVPDPDKRQGVILWSGSCAPKEQKTYTLGFVVKYPKGRMVQGLQ